MAIVMIKCPATAVGISTGIKANASTFARSPVFLSRTRCPICNSDHEWFAGDAWLHDSQITSDGKHEVKFALSGNHGLGN